MSSRHSGMHRALTLLFAGLWALALVWTPTVVEVSEDRAVTSLGQAEPGNEHPATETPRFGAHEPDAGVETDADLACARPLPQRAAAELEQPVCERFATWHGHDIARFARGPPTRA